MRFPLERCVFLALTVWASLTLPALLANDETPPKLIPLPSEVPEPEDNPSTPLKVSLGKQLFFDPRLSGDNQMSCATCHAPEKGFADGLPRAKGDQGQILARNSQSVLNVGFLERFFWDGRAKSLEEQALGPIQSAEEMHQDLDELERELNAIPGYREGFQGAFQTDVTRAGIARALAAFQRTLVTKPSPVDRYLAGDQQALKPLAKQGLELFVGDAGCVRCHQGSLLSDQKFYRLGVSTRDAGQAKVTNDQKDFGKFRTPPLRNIAQTAPYMHDGSKKTLTDVVEYYYRGIPRSSARGQPLDVEPLLDRSFSEIPALVAFLEALTGEVPQIEAPPLP